jgi:hypothetical protein
VSTRTLAVERLFLLERDQQIVAHLQSFDWDFSPGVVRIVCGEEALACRQVASGNHEGNAVVALSPNGSWEDAAAYVRRIQAHIENVLIER